MTNRARRNKNPSDFGIRYNGRRRNKRKRGARDYYRDHEDFEEYRDEWDDEFFSEYDVGQDFQSGRERYRDEDREGWEDEEEEDYYWDD